MNKVDLTTQNVSMDQSTFDPSSWGATSKEVRESHDNDPSYNRGVAGTLLTIIGGSIAAVVIGATLLGVNVLEVVAANFTL